MTQAATAEAPPAVEAAEPLIPDSIAQELIICSQRLEDARDRLDELSEKRREARAGVEALVTEQQNILKQVREGYGPLFAADGPSPSEQEAAKLVDGVGREKDPAGDPDAWKAVLLSHLRDPHISNRVLKPLFEHEPPIVTLGDLTAWQAEKGDFWLKDVKGLGKAAADEIADATIAYWERNAQPAEAPTEAAGEAVEGDQADLALVGVEDINDSEGQSEPESPESLESESPGSPVSDDPVVPGPSNLDEGDEFDL